MKWMMHYKKYLSTHRYSANWLNYSIKNKTQRINYESRNTKLRTITYFKLFVYGFLSNLNVYYKVLGRVCGSSILFNLLMVHTVLTTMRTWAHIVGCCYIAHMWIWYRLHGIIICRIMVKAYGYTSCIRWHNHKSEQLLK